MTASNMEKLFTILNRKSFRVIINVQANFITQQKILTFINFLCLKEELLEQKEVLHLVGSNKNA
jgi:hypothetical protein